MSVLENLDSTRGRKEYEAKVKNLEGIFNKLHNILDISEYEDKFNQIKTDVSNSVNFSTVMISEDMKLDYEDYALIPYTKRLDELLKEVETNLIPFYELHLLISKVNIQISEISLDNIFEVISNTKSLIDLVNSLNTNDNRNKNKLVDKAFDTIYSVILYEELFDKSDILIYINYLNIPFNKENIGRLLSRDLNKLSEKDLIDEDLRTIKTEGLGYDYLNEDIVRKVSRKTVGEKNSEYQERKKQAIDFISLKVKSFEDKYRDTKEKLNSNQDFLEKLRLRRKLITAKFLSKALPFVLIPVITFSVGNSVGKKLSNNITEYKTITRTVDLNTGKVIGEPKEIYDERETTYVATIMEYSPYKKDLTGSGYISNVIAYEYVVPQDIDDDFHLTLEDIDKSVKKEKYRFVDHKDALESTDSTSDYTIQIIETFQDKTQNRKSTKFILPFTILGIGLGVVADAILIYFKKFGFCETNELLLELSQDINDAKLNESQIKEEMALLKDESLLLQEDYNKVVKCYGSLENQLIIPEIEEVLVHKLKKH